MQLLPKYWTIQEILDDYVKKGKDPIKGIKNEFKRFSKPAYSRIKNPWDWNKNDGVSIYWRLIFYDDKINNERYDLAITKRNMEWSEAINEANREIRAKYKDQAYQYYSKLNKNLDYENRLWEENKEKFFKIRDEEGNLIKALEVVGKADFFEITGIKMQPRPRFRGLKMLLGIRR